MALCEHWIAQVPRWFLMNMTSFMILTCFFLRFLLVVFVSFLEVCQARRIDGGNEGLTYGACFFVTHLKTGSAELKALPSYHTLGKSYERILNTYGFPKATILVDFPYLFWWVIA